jgi:N4-gp56 family major capsid protein
MNEAVKILGLQMRTTEDSLTRNVLASTASVLNCTGGVNGDNPTEITRSDIGLLVKTLLGNDCKTVADFIEGTLKFGTGPIRNAYFAMAHTDISNQLENVPGFLHAANYSRSENILESEWGSVGNIRYLLSSNGSIDKNTSGLGANVYNALTCGMEAYAIIKQDKYTAKFIHRPAIFDSPLALNDSVGWKMCTGIKVTNDQWIIKQRMTLA